MSYTTIPGENVATPVDSVESPTRTPPNRRKQLRRGLLFAGAGVLAALALVTAHDRIAAPAPRFAPPAYSRMRAFPTGYNNPYAAAPIAQPQLRMHPRAELMRAASARFAPAAPAAPGFAAPGVPDALRAHPRAELMRAAAARFETMPPMRPMHAMPPMRAMPPMHAMHPMHAAAPRPFVHPALYARYEPAAHAAAPVPVARGMMYDPRGLRMHAAERPPFAPGAPFPPAAEMPRAMPVGAPHFVPRV